MPTRYAGLNTQIPLFWAGFLIGKQKTTPFGEPRARQSLMARRNEHPHCHHSLA